MIQKIAIIGPDDRVARDGSNLDLEAAQGRIYCMKKPLNTRIATKRQLLNQTHIVANAVLAFDSDIGIVSRHIFLSKDGNLAYKIGNCYFEHIASGEVIPIVDSEWPPISKVPSEHAHQDYAIIRLKRAPTGGKPILKEDIIIEHTSDTSKPITVVSNYAANLQRPDALTITSCHKFGFYRLSSNAVSTVWDTDCDDGNGSSGGQVYVEHDNKQKFFALIAGDVQKTPDGGTFDPNRLATLITQFDESLFEAYERLKQRSSI